jgi:ComF family protein
VIAAGRRLLLEALAPSRCAGCDAVSAVVLCAGCRAAVAASPQVLRTLQCGTGAAAFTFDGTVREALHRGKYRGNRAVLHELARLAAPRLLGSLGPPQALVAVPLGARRRRSRGYNQAAEIAGELAALVRVPQIGGLVRERETPPQARRDEAARRQSVDGAFAWRGVPLEGRRLWLVDDVLTTGATVTAAAGPLHRAGARRVDVAVIAAVP